MMTQPRRPERGSSLIVVVIIIAFMLAVGAALLIVTGIAPKVSGSVRNQEEAFDAAEAGFEAARIQIESNLVTDAWTGLSAYCLHTPAGVDDPTQTTYFRKISDTALVQSLSAGTSGVIFYNQAYAQTASGGTDANRTYTVFLIDQGVANDALMVSIGVVWAGNQALATSRLEIDLGLQSSGSSGSTP
jgi:Tfp pilus assembly protein PilX